MTIETTARRIAENIDRYNEKYDVSVDLMTYRLTIMIHNLIIMGSVFLVGFITGKLSDTYLAAVSIGILRSFSGGTHARSLEKCAVITIAVLVFIPYIQLSLMQVHIVNLITAIIVIIVAPKFEKSTIPCKYFPLLKIISVLIVASNFLFQSSVLANSFFIQAITLLLKRR